MTDFTNKVKEKSPEPVPNRIGNGFPDPKCHVCRGTGRDYTDLGGGGYMNLVCVCVWNRKQ